jgi:DNA (cytosine-5)-methyltransferase 1
MKPRLLDLFSCAGGAAVGYARAGFDVVGVDIEPQPHYPFEHHVSDALAFVAEHGHEFDAIHASPPCQGYTTMSAKHPQAQAEWPKLIEPARAALMATGKPWVIENVAGAAKEMRSPLKLSGGMFNLGVERPRLFESNIALTAPPYRRADPVVGVYGRHHDGRRLWTRSDGSELRAAKTLVEGQLAMGISWMTWPELTEAIPPAMTHHIGLQLMAWLRNEMAA